MTRMAGVICALLLAVGVSIGVVGFAEPIHAASVRKAVAPIAVQLVERAAQGCGGVPEQTWDRGTWTCVLSDDFETGRVDLTRWNPGTTSASGFSTGVPPGYVCYVYSPRTVAVSGGQLHLTVAMLKHRRDCGGPAAQPTRFIGGAVSTKKRLTLKYGRVEVRARFAHAKRAGLQSSVELRPDTYVYGRKSGEIDIAEYYTVWPQRVFPEVRYAHKGPDPTARNEACELPNPAEFHTYTAEWTPDRIELQVDGNTCVSTAWEQGKLRRPAPFDQRFFLTLYQGIGSSSDGYLPGQRPRFPATMDIDFVHVWAHAL